MPAQKKYDTETQARAVRMFTDRMAEGGVSQFAVRREVGELPGVKQETLRNWIRRDLGEGTTPAAGQSADDELVELPQGERPAASRERDIEARFDVFRIGGVRPQTRVLIDYIRIYQSRFGV
ncbi:hypothetical protein GCM10028815_31460 [Mariniluteicoccus flavus]